MTDDSGEVTHGDLMRITGLKSEALRFFADRGVVVPYAETNKQGRGVHRRYHKMEVIFALIGRELNMMSVPAKDIVRVRNGMLSFIGSSKSVSTWRSPTGTFALAPSAEELGRVFNDVMLSTAVLNGDPVIMLIDRDRDDCVNIIMHYFREEFVNDEPDIVLSNGVLQQPVSFPRAWLSQTLDKKMEDNRSLRAAEILRLDRVLEPARELFI